MSYLVWDTATATHSPPTLVSSVCLLCGGRVLSLGHNSEAPEEGRSNIPAQGPAASGISWLPCPLSAETVCPQPASTIPPTDVIRLKTLHLKIQFYAKIQIFSPFSWLDRTEPARTPRCPQTCIQQHGFLQRARMFSRVCSPPQPPLQPSFTIDPHSLRTLMGAPLNSTPGLFFLPHSRFLLIFH